MDKVVLGSNVVVAPQANIYGCELKDDVFVGPFVEIQCGVTVGKRSRISSHSFLCEGVEIGEDVFVGHGVMFTNDKFTQEGRPESYCRTTVGNGVRIGSGATLLPVRIGENAVVGAGAVVTKDVLPGSVVCGNPAKVLEKVADPEPGLIGEEKVGTCASKAAYPINIYGKPSTRAPSGILFPVEQWEDVPFSIARIFWLVGVDTTTTRGCHAHKTCHQCLIVTQGECRVTAEDSDCKKSVFELKAPVEGEGVSKEAGECQPSSGCVIMAGHWIEMDKFSPGTTLLVLCSEPLTKDILIDSKTEFRGL